MKTHPLFPGCPRLPPCTQDAFSRVTQDEGLRFIISKAEIIDELESTLPHWLLRRYPGWAPRFVHVLKVSRRPPTRPAALTCPWLDARSGGVCCRCPAASQCLQLCVCRHCLMTVMAMIFSLCLCRACHLTHPFASYPYAFPYPMHFHTLAPPPMCRPFYLAHPSLLLRTDAFPHACTVSM